MSTMKTPSPRQLEVMRLLKRTQLAGKPPPSGYELLAASLSADLLSLRTMLRNLRRQGFVDYRDGAVGLRTLRLTPAGMGVAP